MASPLAPLAPVLGGEMEALGVDAQHPLQHGALVALHDVPRQRQDVLALVVVDEVEVLQRGDNVLLFDAGDLADLIDGDLGSLPPLSLQPHQDLQDGL